MSTNEQVRQKVRALLSNDNTGHGMDHIDRVVSLSLKLASSEGADPDITELIALLHDVDDYKLFGTQNAEQLTNAKRILSESSIPEDTARTVLSQIATIGYNKRLAGIAPTTLEGMIVSDADMCDAIGVRGVLRAYKYSIKDGKPFFDKEHFPIENITPEIYKTHDADSTVCHIFEKILKLKELMLTESGKKEAAPRHDIVVSILHHLFEEENADDWLEYLDKKYG